MRKFKLPYQKDSVEESFFRFPRFTAKHLGFWPDKEKTAMDMFRLVLHVTIISSSCCGQVALAYVLRNQMLVCLEAICPFATLSVTTVKILIFFFRSESIRSVMERTRQTLLEEKREEDIKIIREYALKATLCTFFVFWFGISTNFFYSVPPFTRTAISYFSDQNLTTELGFKVKLPKFLDDWHSSSWYAFTITYVWTSYSGYIAVFGFTGVDGVFFGFCLYISAKFKCIQNVLTNKFKDAVSNGEFSFHFLF